MSFLAGRVAVADGVTCGPLGRRRGAYYWRELSVILAGLAAAIVIAATLTFGGLGVIVLLVPLGALVAAVAIRPVIAAYLLIGVTPLVAGMSRGAAVPMLRPQEGLLVLAGVGLGARALFRLKASSRFRPSLSRLDVAILLLAIASSVIPLAWMVLRGQAIAKDDVLYALMVWKYYGIFLVFRVVVRSPDEVRRCLWLSLGSAAVVGVVAILQASHHFGISGFLAKYYAYSTYSGDVSAANNSRGGSTLGLPIATADLMVFNLAIAIGLLRSTARRWPLLLLASLFVVAVFAAAEFSGVIGLIVGSITIALVTRRFRYIALMPAAFVPAALVLKTAVSTRLQGFQSTSGLPVSWEGRLQHLENYFFPKLLSGEHWILGIRPAARVIAPNLANGYIWIESGYVWLLWAGGVPLLASFFYFLWKGGRAALAVFRSRIDAPAAAALGAITALSLVGLLMITDPHLTYRGSADLLFALLGITAAARAMPVAGARTRVDDQIARAPEECWEVSPRAHNHPEPGGSARPREHESVSSQVNQQVVQATVTSQLALRTFYRIKPLIPRRAQITTRRRRASRIWRELGHDPCQRIPSSPLGYPWPHGARACVLLTHDVELASGQRHVGPLTEIEEALGLRSCWNFVVRRYQVDVSLVNRLRERGHEIGVHGVHHDGKLFASEARFREQLAIMEEAAGQWGAAGFRSPSLLYDLTLLSTVTFGWDSSMPAWDPFQPKPGDCYQYVPFPVNHQCVELPVTMWQDFTLFEELQMTDINVWRAQVDAIYSAGGMINVIVHPDYMMTTARRQLYQDLLAHLCGKEALWFATPSEVAAWHRTQARQTNV